MTTKRWALTGAVGLAVVAGALVVQAQMRAEPVPGLLPYQDAQRIATGAEIYADHCAACHGAQLEGQADWQLRDADGYLPAPPHDVTGHTWHHPDAQLIDIVTRGTEAIVGGGYRSMMMGYGDILTPQQITDVLAYIKSTWPAEVIEIHNDINARAEAFGQ